MHTSAAGLRRARVAVALLFVVNAATYANVVPRLPAIKADLGLSNTALGTAVAAMPVGALLSGPAAGWLVHRWRSGRVAVACGTAFGLLLPGFALAPSWVGLAGTFFLLGLLDSLMDVSMNAHALRVQRGYDRSIVNSLHGLWSIGAVAGGAAGAVAAGAGWALEWHLAGAGAVMVLLSLLAGRAVLPGPDDTERDELPAERAAADETTRRRARRALVLLGLLVLLAGIVEDAPASWGAVLLRTEMGTSAAVAGFVFIAFQVAMTVGRLGGDRIVDRFGDVAVLRSGGLLIAVGVGAGLLVGEPAAVIAGFAVAGFGAASLFPVVFHAAGNLPGVSTGHGVAVVAWMSRVGFLTVPPVVGVIGDATSVRWGLALVPAAGLAVAAFARSALSPSARA